MSQRIDHMVDLPLVVSTGSPQDNDDEQDDGDTACARKPHHPDLLPVRQTLHESMLRHGPDHECQGCRKYTTVQCSKYTTVQCSKYTTVQCSKYTTVQINFTIYKTDTNKTVADTENRLLLAWWRITFICDSLLKIATRDGNKVMKSAANIYYSHIISMVRYTTGLQPKFDPSRI